MPGCAFLRRTHPDVRLDRSSPSLNTSLATVCDPSRPERGGDQSRHLQRDHPSREDEPAGAQGIAAKGEVSTHCARAGPIVPTPAVEPMTVHAKDHEALNHSRVCLLLGVLRPQLAHSPQSSDSRERSRRREPADETSVNQDTYEWPPKGKWL